jgi:hypothetical protein
MDYRNLRYSCVKIDRFSTRRELAGIEGLRVRQNFSVYLLRESRSRKPPPDGAPEA